MNVEKTKSLVELEKIQTGTDNITLIPIGKQWDECAIQTEDDLKETAYPEGRPEELVA